MIVGTAEVLVVPITKGFEKELKDSTAPAFGSFKKDAAAAGASAGAGMRTGVTRETEKVASDVEKHGVKAGESFGRGMKGGLSSASSALSGLPITPVQALGAAVLISAGAAVHLGEEMQSADARIAGAAGTSVASATKIGDAFLGTGGKAEFSGQQMATAFAGVAGQLKTTEGHALDAKQSLEFMSAASDLAAAKQIDLGAATNATAGIIQAFQLTTGDAAHVTDVLFSASSATGQGVDTLASALEKVRSKLGDAAPPLGDLAGLMVDMTKQGITGRAALGALNTSMNGLIKPSKDGAKEIKTLGLETFDARGRFVGLGSVIEQLHPKFAKMTQEQQLQAATAIFGAGAARQMTAVINAGPAAYDKATASVNRHGAAQTAAAQQARTLHGETRTLVAGLTDLATKIGAVLIPIITSMVGWLVKATTFVTTHKAALIALAAVVTGILAPAIAVFTINKMASFGQSFVTAGGHVKDFASGVESVVGRVIAAFTKQNAATEAMAAVTKTQTGIAGAASAAQATETTAASTTIEAENTAAGASFAGEAGAATAASAGVGADVAAEAAAVTAADTTIEAENAAAAASFTAVLGALSALAAGAAAVFGGAAAFRALQNLVVGPGASPTAASNFGVTGVQGAGVNPPGTMAPGAPHAQGPNVQGPTSAGGTPATSAPPGTLGAVYGQLGITPPSPNASGQYPGTGVPRRGHIATAPAGLTAHIAGVSAKVKKASDVLAKAASGNLTKAQLMQLWVQAGGNPADANMAASIALAESGGDPNATGNNTNGSVDRGLWQINSVHGAQSTYDQLANARSAVAISNNGTNWNPWVTYQRGMENQFLNRPPTSYSGAGAGAAPVTVGGATQSVQAQQRTSAQNLAAARAQLTKTIAQETAQTNAEIARLKASASGKGVSAGEKTKVAAEIAALKAALQIEIAQQRAALGEQTKAQQAESKKQSTDLKAGTTQLTKMLAAIHSGKLADLQKAIDSAHQAGLSNIEKDLNHDHSAALAALSKQLVQVHKQAMAELVKAQKEAAAAAAAAAQATELDQASKITAAQAKQQADQIADATKVYLDRQAELSSTTITNAAAQAQTNLDWITMTMTQAIDAAQVAVDQASGGSTLAQAQAANTLAQAQANATVSEAQAQSVLDKASASAQTQQAAIDAAATAAATAAPAAATSSANPAPSSTAPAPAASPVFNFSIFGNGNLTAAQLFSEVKWALSTGALPVAAPVPAAA